MREARGAGPSASTTRLAVLVLTLLGSAGFAGLLLHNSIRGREWLFAIRGCLEHGDGSPVGADPFAAQDALQRCEASTEGPRGLFALGAIGVVVVLVLVAAFVEARRVERSRRLTPLEPILPESASRAHELAREAGVKAPGLMLRFGNQSDAFTYGVPGRYRIALPRGVALQPATPLFDSTMRHELQHIAHRDVALAWSLRGSVIVLGGLLIPVTLVPLWREPSFVGDILWRAAVLALVVVLALNSWLRTREFDADARAAAVAGDVDGLATTLSTWARRQERPAGHVQSWWSALRANHPTSTARIIALRHPELTPTTGFVDGLVIGFAVALTRPLVDGIAGPLLSSLGNSDLLPAVTAWVAGPLAGMTLGLGLWSHARQRQFSRRRPIGPLVALGVLIGSVVGQGTTPAGSGLGGLGGLNHPASALVPALTLAGATLLAAGLAEVVAGARLPGRWAPIVVAALSALLFAGVLWICAVVQLLVDQLPWAITSMAIVVLVPSVPLAMLALALAVCVILALARGARSVGVVLAAGGLSGAAGALVIVSYRLLQGPATTDAALEARFYGYLALAALTAAAAGGVMQALRGPAGAGEAIACAVVSALVTSAGFLALNTAYGGALTAEFAWAIIRPALALTLVALLAIAVIAGLVGVMLRGRRMPAGVTVAVVTAVSLATAAGTLALRDQLLPGFAASVAAAAHAPTPTPGPPTPAPAPSPTDQNPALRPVGAVEYTEIVVPALTSAWSHAQDLSSAALGNTGGTNAQRAASIDQQVLPALRRLLTTAERVTSDDPEVTAAHRHLLSCVRLELSAFELVSQGLREGDSTLVARGASTAGQATAEMRAWLDMLQVLAQR